MAVSILATDGGSKKGNLREQSVTDIVLCTVRGQNMELH